MINFSEVLFFDKQGPFSSPGEHRHRLGSNPAQVGTGAVKELKQKIERVGGAPREKQRKMEAAAMKRRE